MAERTSEGGQDDAARGVVALVAEPLTADAFAPFGAIIGHDGQGGRWFVPEAFAAQDGVRPNLWVNPVPLAQGSPVHVTALERHPFSAQNFLPLRGGRWLVVVAESGADGLPHCDRIRAFVTHRHQGITYRLGTWHHGLLALDEAAEVAVVMCLTGREDDTQFEDLARPVAIGLPPS